MSEEKDIGRIANHYGSLSVKEVDGKYFWGIENWNGTFWEEIPDYLYSALIKFEDETQEEE